MAQTRNAVNDVPCKVDKIRLNREQDRRTKFTDEQVNKMRKLYSKRYTQKEIAKMFNTRQNTVCYIVSDKAHRHLAVYRQDNPPKRRTKEESCTYMRDLRNYKKNLLEKGGEG